MTDSIFDPGGPNTERSGNRNMGPDAANISHMPSDVTDGKVERDDAAPDENLQTEEIAEAERELQRDTGPNSAPHT